MYPKYKWGKSFTIDTILLDAGTRNAKSNPTLASGDVRISVDGGAFANMVIGGSGVSVPNSDERVQIIVTASQAQSKRLLIRFRDQTATAEWEEQTIALSVSDVREEMTPLTVPSGFVERSGIISTRITATNKPAFGLLYTAQTTPSQYSFDTDILLGATIYHPSTGISLKILGGYYFDDSGDTTEQVFGIASRSDYFSLRSGKPIPALIGTWAGYASEGTHGSGWTFIVVDGDPVSTISSFDDLEIWVPNSSFVEHQITDQAIVRLRQLNLKGYDEAGLYVSKDGDGADAPVVHIVGVDENEALKIENLTQYGKGVLVTVGDGSGDGYAVKASANNHNATPTVQILGLGDATGLDITSKTRALDLKADTTAVVSIAALTSGVGVSINGANSDAGLFVGGGASGNAVQLSSGTDKSALFARGNGIGHDIDAPNSDLGIASGDATEAKQDQIISTLGTPAGASMSADVADIDADIAVVDGKVDIITSNQSAINSGISDVYVDTQEIVGSGVSLNPAGVSQVNSQVADVLYVDKITELPDAQPPKEPTFAEAIMLKYMAMRNETEQTQSLFKVKNDIGTPIAKSPVNKVAGVSVSKGKMVAGSA